MSIKPNYLYFFKSVKGINPFVCQLDLKEVFLNNSIVEIPYVILSIDIKPMNTKTVSLKKFLHQFGEPIAKLPIYEFTKQYEKELRQIVYYDEENNLNLNWLQKFQIAPMLRSGKDIESSIEDLNSYIKSY